MNSPMKSIIPTDKEDDMSKFFELDNATWDAMPRWVAFTMVPVIWHILAWCVKDWSIVLHAVTFIPTV